MCVWVGGWGERDPTHPFQSAQRHEIVWWSHLLFDEFQYVDENTVGDDGGDDVAVTQGVIPGGVVCVHDHTHDLRGQHRQHHGDVKLHPYLGHPSVYKSNINICLFLIVKLHVVMRFNINIVY